MTDVPSITGAGCVLWSKLWQGRSSVQSPASPPRCIHTFTSSYVQNSFYCKVTRVLVMYVCVCLSLWTIQYFPVIYPDSGQPGKTFSFGLKVPVEDFELGWGVKGSGGGGRVNQEALVGPYPQRPVGTRTLYKYFINIC